ncbi:hypothetical protein AB0N24_15240 [Arthrobacter sp. NPDC093128]|uniref:hypothetical protein n=1 Tax=Arthrobacter sp. NPDC093128 TaxID=3154979 RepID=UPI003418A4EF
MGCHEGTDGGLGFFACRSLPEQVAGRLQLDEHGTGDGVRIVLSVGESDTGILA